MLSNEKSTNLKHTHSIDKPLEKFITIISFAYMLVLIAELYLVQNAIWYGTFVILDTLICIIFLFEFFYFISKSKHKVGYFKKHFIDILSAIPFMLLSFFTPALAIFNLFKVLRGLKIVVKIYEYLANKKADLLVKLLVFFVIIVAYFAIIIVTLEKDINSGLNYFHDGVWLAVTTITSVGYGDITPVTYLGKIFSVLAMVGGIGIASAIGALFVRWILKPGQKKLYDQEMKIEHQEEEISKRENVISTRENKIISRLDRIEKAVMNLTNKPSLKSTKKKKKN